MAVVNGTQVDREVGRDRNGVEIFQSDVTKVHREIEPVLVLALQQLALDPDKTDMTVEVDLLELLPDGQTWFSDSCVRTYPDDEVTYARKVHFPHRSRFVRNRHPECNCKVQIIVARWGKDKPWILVKADPGKLPPPEPSTPNLRAKEKAESEEFWANHAYLYDPMAILAGTESSAW